MQPCFQLLRALHPFRWLHPYGVFPPNNTPPVKMVPVFEVSWDDGTWHELEFRYSVSHEGSAPRFIAPHHPRGDQALIYDTFGLNGPHRPAETIDPEFWADASGDPELWHFEAIAWRRRSRLAPWIERARTASV